MILAHHEVGLIHLLLALPGAAALGWAWFNSRRASGHQHPHEHTHGHPHTHCPRCGGETVAGACRECTADGAA